MPDEVCLDLNKPPKLVTCAEVDALDIMLDHQTNSEHRQFRQPAVQEDSRIRPDPIALTSSPVNEARFPAEIIEMVVHQLCLSLETSKSVDHLVVRSRIRPISIHYL